MHVFLLDGHVNHRLIPVLILLEPVLAFKVDPRYLSNYLSHLSVQDDENYKVWVGRESEHFQEAFQELF